MRRILFSVSLLVASAGLAQAPVQAANGLTLHHTNPLQGWNCPVSMNARLRGTGATRWVVGQEDSREPEARARAASLGVHVGLKAPWALRTATVAVEYMVPPAGAMLVESGQMVRTKTFEISAGEDPAQEMESSLLLGAGVSINRVKLVSFTYADGTVWQAGGNYNCSVQVSHLLLVGAGSAKAH